MIRAVKTFISSLRASAVFGRACRLRDQGKKAEALLAARETLSILSQPDVIRTSAMVVSSVVCSTVLVEQLAHELNQPGASASDVDDSLRIIRALGHESELADWVPYLEWCANQRGPSAV